jgi:hypothetical protein
MDNNTLTRFILNCNKSLEAVTARHNELGEVIKAQHEKGLCDHEKEDQEIEQLLRLYDCLSESQACTIEILKIRGRNEFGLN